MYKAVFLDCVHMCIPFFYPGIIRSICGPSFSNIIISFQTFAFFPFFFFFFLKKEKIAHNLGEILVNFSLHDFQEMGSKGASRAFNYVLECVGNFFSPSGVQYFTRACFSRALKCDSTFLGTAIM